MNGGSILRRGVRTNISVVALVGLEESLFTRNMHLLADTVSRVGGAMIGFLGLTWTTVCIPITFCSSAKEGSIRANTFYSAFKAIPGAAGYQLSNPSILDLTALLSSLTLFSAATMPALRTKSVLLTGYLEHLLNSQFSTFSPKPFTILTPFDPNARGAQLSLLFSEGLMMLVFDALLKKGVVVDDRKPDVMRVTPCPLYNSFSDVWQFVQELRVAVEGVQALRDAQGAY